MGNGVYTLNVFTLDRFAVLIYGTLGNNDNKTSFSSLLIFLNNIAHYFFPFISSLKIWRALRYNNPICTASNSWHQCQVSAMAMSINDASYHRRVPAHNFNNKCPLVTGSGWGNGISRFDDAMEGRVCTTMRSMQWWAKSSALPNRWVRATHVIVDWSYQADNRQIRMFVHCFLGRQVFHAISDIFTTKLQLSETRSFSKLHHSERKISAPVRLPSPPTTTRASIPWCMVTKLAKHGIQEISNLKQPSCDLLEYETHYNEQFLQQFS